MKNGSQHKIKSPTMIARVLAAIGEKKLCNNFVEVKSRAKSLLRVNFVGILYFSFVIFQRRNKQIFAKIPLTCSVVL